jgi:hypothetical protein
LRCFQSKKTKPNKNKTMKLAVILISDPKSNTEEALGRAFNALVLVQEAKAKGDDVLLAFTGTGTRWPKELNTLGHPAYELYQAVRDTVRGASCSCAEVFGAKTDVENSGVSLLKVEAANNGLSLRALLEEDYNVHIF